MRFPSLRSPPRRSPRILRISWPLVEPADPYKLGGLMFSLSWSSRGSIFLWKSSNGFDLLCLQRGFQLFPQVASWSASWIMKRTRFEIVCYCGGAKWALMTILFIVFTFLWNQNNCRDYIHPSKKLRIHNKLPYHEQFQGRNLEATSLKRIS